MAQAISLFSEESQFLICLGPEWWHFGGAKSFKIDRGTQRADRGPESRPPNGSQWTTKDRHSVLTKRKAESVDPESLGKFSNVDPEKKIWVTLKSMNQWNGCYYIFHLLFNWLMKNEENILMTHQENIYRINEEYSNDHHSSKTMFQFILWKIKCILTFFCLCAFLLHFPNIISTAALMILELG